MYLPDGPESVQKRYSLAVEHARAATLSGLAIRWQQSLWQIANKTRDAIAALDLPKDVYKTSKRDTDRILAAARIACSDEFPPIFSLAPMIKRTIVQVEAIDPVHGQTVPGSVASVGVLSGFVGDVDPRLAFEENDLEFAARCLYAHKDNGTLHPGSLGAISRMSRPPISVAAEIAQA